MYLENCMAITDCVPYCISLALGDPVSVMFTTVSREVIPLSWCDLIKLALVEHRVLQLFKQFFLGEFHCFFQQFSQECVGLTFAKVMLLKEI